MKKFVVAILSIVYLGTSTGATIHYHYCMDKLVYWGLESQQDKKCSKCGMEKSISNKGCCKDEQKQIKLQTDQKVVDAFLLSFYFLCDADIIPFIQYQPSFSIAQSLKLPFSNAPPGRERANLYLRNNVFRI